MESSIELLKRLITEGEKYTFENFSSGATYSSYSHTTYGGKDSPEWLAWKVRSFNLVKQLTEQNSPSFLLAKEAASIITAGNGSDHFDRAKSTFLKALKITLEVIQEDKFGEVRSSKSSAGTPELSNKVFVVHGHDSALKTDVERFIHQIGLEPVVLHRQPDKGQTIIEKFEENSDVGYAFILLTPDEFAYTVDQEKLPDVSRKKELRARPNVIFEFGFFVGKLGRQRVCCIYKEGVILPSDLTGLIYKKVSDSIDSQAYSIIQELKAAGYKIQI
jgi:predicted nucleotide-binding protein